MKTLKTRCSRRDGGGWTAEQDGSVIVIAMVFTMVFLILGIGLYWLVSSQTRATELERTDIKAFNVAEAGIDAGMLALKLDWPDEESTFEVSDATIRTVIGAGENGLWFADRLDEPQRTEEFIHVEVYDNIDPGTGDTTTIADPSAPKWDSNTDGMMFVDSTANVDNDRHRILILAERQEWELTFPATLALWAGVVDSNGQGLEVKVEDPYPVPVDPYAYFDVHDAQGKGVDEGYGVDPAPSPTTFDQVVSEAVQAALMGIAMGMGTYFEGPSADTEASAFLGSGQANGKVVYVKADSSVTISGNTQIGTEDEPVVVVIDTPDGSENTWDMKGTADFYGILVTIGDSVLRGTCGIHGAMYCSGTLANKGNGSSGEINYNEKCITNINGQYVISVNIVPNTWEEYTLPRSSTTSTGP
ncbi:MAG: pilus assembly PilX N-terminal domain-containing protein [Actinomycetia bacterium]|nr:pilus assembly PilX N-terminal domain-containing protein [Actinomycetes bacterium]